MLEELQRCLHLQRTFCEDLRTLTLQTFVYVTVFILSFKNLTEIKDNLTVLWILEGSQRAEVGFTQDVLGPVWSVRRSSPRCGAALCCWTGR